MCTLGIFGFDDDTIVIRSWTAHHDHAASTFQLHASLINVLPSHSRELSIVSIAPQCLAQGIMSAPGLTGQQHSRILAVGFEGIDTGDVIPVDNACGTTDDVVLIEALDDADEAVEALEIDMVLAVPDGFPHCLYGCALFL